MNREETSGARLRRALIRSAGVCACMVGASVAVGQTVPFEAVTALSNDVVPVEQELVIPQSGSGQYRITLTDTGALAQVPGPAPLDSLHVLITRGRTVVATLDAEADPQSPIDTKTFDATPGTYAVHIVGKPGPNEGSGSVSLLVEDVASGNDLLTVGTTLSPRVPARTDVGSYGVDIEVPVAGEYELKLADLQFPRALDRAGAYLFPAGGTLSAFVCAPAVAGVCSGSATVTLAAGTYTVAAFGGLPLSGSDAGVFSVHMRAVASGAVVHTRAVEIGNIKRLSPTSFQLDAGSHTVSLKDLQFPAALTSGSVMVTRAAEIAALANETTPTAAFTVASNDTAYDVFAYASADAAEGAGVYSAEVLNGAGTSVLNAVEVVGGSSGTPAAFAFPADLPSAGSYRVRLGDFEYPARLSSVRIAIVQNGAVVGTKDSANAGGILTLDLPSLAVGRATAIAVVRPAAVGGTVQQSAGTFGLDLAPVGGAAVIDVTQGVGALISVRKITFTQAGKYDLTLSDLDFPEAFPDLMAVVSRGAQRLGTVLVGGGTNNSTSSSASLQDFQAEVGSYSVTIVAQPAASHNAAAYAIAVLPSPPAPTVTLTADPQTVTSGNTTKLTWNAQNATSCTASSTPTSVWSGTKAVSANENSAAITAATTFKLSCVGEGGRSSEATVSVTIASNQSDGGGGGGGGSLGWLGILGLAACRALAQVRRCRSEKLFGSVA